MANIQDYESLTQAISDYLHRADVASNLFTDYFIQIAQNTIANDIIANNFGNGIQYMEVASQPFSILGGTAPVPSDWFTPKNLQISDGSDTFPLIFKAASWIYDTYPIRQPTGLPAYIARDLQANCAFTASVAGNVLTVASVSSGTIQAGMFIDDTTGFILNPCQIVSFGTGTGGVGTYNLNVPAQTINIEGMTGGGNVFIFGPYPDSAYTVQGTYYSKGLALSANQTTNWMVLNIPECLLACCLAEAGKFLKDQSLLSLWIPIYQAYLQSIVTKDKGERWSASTMQIESG